VLTETVHCKSEGETGVEKALTTCARMYLKRVLTQSPARVVFVVGAQAARAVTEVFGLDDWQEGDPARVGPVRLSV
jgi:hypothetical protein